MVPSYRTMANNRDATMITKERYPLCFSVAYYEARYFIYHAFKVREDRLFIIDLINKKDTKNLDFMESFYNKLREEQTCNKDIYSRNSFNMLPLSAVLDMDDGGPSEEMKEFEEIKIKRGKKRTSYIEPQETKWKTRRN